MLRYRVCANGRRYLTNRCQHLHLRAQRTGTNSTNRFHSSSAATSSEQAFSLKYTFAGKVLAAGTMATTGVMAHQFLLSQHQRDHVNLWVNICSELLKQVGWFAIYASFHQLMANIVFYYDAIYFHVSPGCT